MRLRSVRNVHHGTMVKHATWNVVTVQEMEPVTYCPVTVRMGVSQGGRIQPVIRAAQISAEETEHVML